jgi:hypothetical protein
MMMVKADKNFEAGEPPNPALMAAIQKVTEEAIRSGSLVDMGGLLPSSQGALVRVRGGKLTVIDGPFSEAKELVGGYAIFDVKSKEEAIRLGREFMQLHSDVLGASYEGELEIRQMMDAPDGAQR